MTLLGLKVLLLAFAVIGGFAGVCLSNLRGCNAFEAALNGNRGARWESAGWFCGLLLSACVTAGAMTWALDLLRQQSLP